MGTLKSLCFLSLVPLFAACSASVTTPGTDDLFPNVGSQPAKAVEDLVAGPNLDGVWETECAPTPAGQYVRLKLDITGRKAKRDQSIYADAACKGRVVDFLVADTTFRYLREYNDGVYEVEYKVPNGTIINENIKLEGTVLKTSFGSSGSGLVPNISLKRIGGNPPSNAGGQPVTNHYDGVMSDECRAAWNWKSARHVMCSHQGGFSYYEADQGDGRLESLKLTWTGKSGNQIVFGKTKVNSTSRGFDLKLFAEGGHTLSFEGFKKTSAQKPEMGYSVLNGSSGSCEALVVATRPSCVAVYQQSASDQLFPTPFHFPEGHTLRVENCELVAQKTTHVFSSIANFTVKSPDTCSIKGKQLRKGVTVEFDLKNDANYPLLTTP